MNWIINHASEIAVAIIVVVATKTIDYFFAKRPKVVAFFTHGAQFAFTQQNAQNPVQGYVNTMALALQNTGRAPAEEIKIVHRRQPTNYQVYPPTNSSMGQLPNGEWELRIPTILPKQVVFVSYLDGLPLDASFITYMATNDRTIRSIQIQFTHLWPAWFRYAIITVFMVGVLVVFRYVYFWLTEAVRYIASH
jgi:hypothetical protein